MSDTIPIGIIIATITIFIDILSQKKLLYSLNNKKSPVLEHETRAWKLLEKNQTFNHDYRIFFML